MFVIPEDVKKRLMKRYPDRCAVWVLNANGTVDYSYVSSIRVFNIKYSEFHAHFQQSIGHARRNNGSWVKAWAIMRLSDGVVLARSR